MSCQRRGNDQAHATRQWEYHQSMQWARPANIKHQWEQEYWWLETAQKRWGSFSRPLPSLASTCLNFLQYSNTLGGAWDQFPFAQPPSAAAGAAVVAGEAGVDFFSKGDCTWNLFPALGDVDFSSGDFTWNGDPTETVAIFLSNTFDPRKVWTRTLKVILTTSIGWTNSTPISHQQ